MARGRTASRWPSETARYKPAGTQSQLGDAASAAYRQRRLAATRTPLSATTRLRPEQDDQARLVETARKSAVARQGGVAEKRLSTPRADMDSVASRVKSLRRVSPVFFAAARKSRAKTASLRLRARSWQEACLLQNYPISRSASSVSLGAGAPASDMATGPTKKHYSCAEMKPKGPAAPL